MCALWLHHLRPWCIVFYWLISHLRYLWFRMVWHHKMMQVLKSSKWLEVSPIIQRIQQIRWCRNAGAPEYLQCPQLSHVYSVRGHFRHISCEWLQRTSQGSRQSFRNLRKIVRVHISIKLSVLILSVISRAFAREPWPTLLVGEFFLMLSLSLNWIHKTLWIFKMLSPYIQTHFTWSSGFFNLKYSLNDLQPSRYW